MSVSVKFTDSPAFTAELGARSPILLLLKGAGGQVIGSGD